jgi:hypothetical protein
MSAAPNVDRHPYAEAARPYWDAGWHGVLPLPPRAKANPPTGWTGFKAGPYPSWPDIQAWIDSHHAHGNLALRLPRGVIGIDVDDYGDKQGGKSYAEAVQQWGELPATWRSTSREGVSGIRLFTVPEGLQWPGNLGLNSGIDIISYRYRYVVAPPSLHPEGRTYRWVTPDGITALPGTFPKVDAFPDLPDSWVTGITGGVAENETPRAELDSGEMKAWLMARKDADPCPRMRDGLERYVRDLKGGSAARHDIALAASLYLIARHGEGHHGAVRALMEFEREWMRAVAGDRGQREASAEWMRALTGAVDIAAVAHPTPGPTDPCEWPTVVDIPVPAADPLAVPLTTPLTAPDAPPAAAGADEEGERPRATWARTDLVPFITGTYKPPVAALMPRTDGVCLLYPGLTHSMHGESESGKSWVAQAEAARCIKEGQPVLYVDFESDAGSIVERLLLLGASTEQILEHFDYRQPESSPAAAHEIDAWHDMLGQRYDFAVIDGVTDAMGLFGRKVVDNDEIAAWMRAFPRRLATTTGAAVVMIDHVTKDKESRGRFAIGGQAKMASISGAAYVVDVVHVLGKGRKGELTIRVAKDRPGGVRGKSGPERQSDRTQEAARFTLDSRGETLIAELAAPAYGFNGDDESRPAQQWRPTGLMEKVSTYLREIQIPCSQTNIETSVPGKAEYLRTALRLLLQEGYLKAERRGQGTYYSHLRPYVELEDTSGTEESE